MDSLCRKAAGGCLHYTELAGVEEAAEPKQRGALPSLGGVRSDHN